MFVCVCARARVCVRARVRVWCVCVCGGVKLPFWIGDKVGDRVLVTSTLVALTPSSASLSMSKVAS